MMIVSREKSEIHPLVNKITSLCPGVYLAARTHNSSRKRKKKKKLHPLRKRIYSRTYLGSVRGGRSFEPSVQESVPSTE